MKELRMTLICKTCSNQYGRWRPRCPACGTANDAPETFNSPRVTDDPIIKALREPRARRPKSRECIACHRGGAKVKCPHCDELIHKPCLVLHRDDCAAFQVTREAAINKLNVTG